MAKTLSVAKEDILRGKTVTPGWYPIMMKKVEDATASTGVDGWTVTFIIEKEPFMGVPVDFRIWENAPGFAAPLLAVLQGKKEADPGNFDLSNGVGKKMMGYIENGKWNGRATNQIVDFRPLGS